MSLKIAMLLLAALIVSGIIGRARAQRVDRTKSSKIEAARKCETCGAYALAGAPCERGDCPRR